jgi:hypothetical protein
MMISKRKNGFQILVILVLLGVILAACSPKDRLLGVWDEQGGDLHVRFHTGDFVSQRAYFGEDVLSLTGTYEILNDSQIRIEFQEGEWRGLESGLYDYSISGNELRLDEMTFERRPDVYTLE